MSVSDPQPPRTGSLPTVPQQKPLTPEQERFKSVVYKVALVTLVAAPALAFMPPRKLDFYTMGLGVTWVLCVNHLMEEHGLYDNLYRNNKKAISMASNSRSGSTAAHIVKMEEIKRSESGMSISERMQKDLLEVWDQDLKKKNNSNNHVDDEKKAILDEVYELEAKRRIEERFKSEGR